MQLMCGIVLGRLALGTPLWSGRRISPSCGSFSGVNYSFSFFKDFSGVM